MQRSGRRPVAGDDNICIGNSGLPEMPCRTGREPPGFCRSAQAQRVLAEHSRDHTKRD